MSDYCTSAIHAERAARYIIGARRLADHKVKIQTTHEALTSPLAPGDFIKVALDYTHYNQFVNGAVTGDGKLVSSTDLSDGTYQVVYWTGEQAAEVVDGTMRVSNGGTTATPAGIVFTVKTSEILTRTYRIESIQPSEEGYEIEAIHSPLLSDGTLQLYAEWTDDSYWVTV
jgi:predicted phage tail protein